MKNIFVIIYNKTRINVEVTHFTRLETWEINSEIDSSVAKEEGEGSFDGLTSFASCNGTSDLAGVEAAAFEDPSTATLKATDDPKSLSRKEQKFENRSSKKNH